MESNNFSEIQMSDELRRGIGDMGYASATSIQSQAIPLIAAGEDVIGLSQTGSGKTAAFGLPAIDLIDMEMDPRRVQVLIVCPTRELAMQSCGEITKFSKYKRGIRAVPVYGGEPFNKQLMRMKGGCQIIVGTPGRIMDHMRRRTIRLDNVKLVVLDEADEMLNMGFLEDIETILQDTPETRQTLLFSATMSAAIMQITKQFQRTPKTIKIESTERTVSTIEQNYVICPRGKKPEVLYNLIEFYSPKVSIVFCNTKKMVDELVDKLNGNNYPARGLHGDMRQTERTQVMREFKNNRFGILVATDVAARGLDINDVEIVFNYDLPQEDEYYIHRVGRTGRAGKTGRAISLMQGRNQIYQIRNLASFAKCKITELAIPTKSRINEKNVKALAAELCEQLQSEDFSKYANALETVKSQGFTSEQLSTALFGMLLRQRSGGDENTEELVFEPEEMREPAHFRNRRNATGGQRSFKQNRGGKGGYGKRHK